MDEELEYFYSRIDKKENGCWVWRGLNNPRSCGKVRGEKAHRWSYKHFKGPIENGLYVCHKCDNPPCCNPDHLFLGTPKDNILDAKQKGRLATGDKHGTHTHPESRTVGLRNGAYTRPEKGPQHSAYLKQYLKEHPEKVKRGDECTWTKLSPSKYEEVFEMRKSGCSLKEMAAKFNVSIQRISNICCAAGLRGRP
jgi:hypothetical protein